MHSYETRRIIERFRRQCEEREDASGLSLVEQALDGAEEALAEIMHYVQGAEPYDELDLQLATVEFDDGYPDED